MQEIRAVWVAEHTFDTSRPGGPVARIDGNAIAGQSPVDMLLSAVAVCSGIDALDIIAKRKTPVTRMEVVATGERRPDHPKRFMSMELHYIVDGEGIEAVHAERAIQLSFERYCSVAASLGPDITVHTKLTLNGEAFAPVERRIWDPRSSST